MDEPIDYAALDAGRDCNYWELDPTLRRAAERAYPSESFAWASDRLREFGEVVGTTVVENSEAVEAHGPELHTYDRHGEVQNRVEYHPALEETERIAYSDFGLAHDAFHAPPGEDAPMGFVHALTLQSLLSYADPGFVCPASMTVGAALVLDRFADGERLEEYFHRLTTRDAEDYIEGAMFLTERQGGSDVGANETTAVETDEDGVYRLTGEKWFCSNIDAEGTLALARREGAPEGTEGLSLFLVPHTKADGELNDQLYRRLKDKLGTISVPTGEVEFRGAEGYLVGEPERGFRYMTEMLNYERLSNAAASVGIMGRCLLESKVHAANREAFGRTIDEYPLMRRDLVEMTVDYEAAVAVTFAAARLFERYHRDDDEEAYRLMRLLVPVAKYRTAREAVEAASYACEVLGGNGYVSGFTTERMLRDAQVLPIWEGTSNVLSLDVLRVLAREAAHEVFVPAVRERLDAVEHGSLAAARDAVAAEFDDLQSALDTLAAADTDYAQLQAKELADYVYDVFAAAELLAVAQAEIDDGDGRAALVTREFATARFGRRTARGITDGDRQAIDEFDAFVRYAAVEPTVAEPEAAND
ncbi:acyl-CoA dehydrogenase family protein [Halomarina halobia]|uniref:Acyl-CoA dehydrogenase family protein n=1 Tax=Halomarina halobia TaxID=3033386 RepID=A0ABD6A7C2_9EURY|nr:acyl-CoA dehydrogenase family protein [Halomarina sp. PSR21]